MFNLFKKQPKNVNKQIVKEVAYGLIGEHGATTTLEVKNHLRSNHYIAYQAEISSLMNEVAQEAGWSSCWNGRFKVYFLSVPQDNATMLNVPPFSQN